MEIESKKRIVRTVLSDNILSMIEVRGFDPVADSGYSSLEAVVLVEDIRLHRTVSSENSGLNELAPVIPYVFSFLTIELGYFSREFSVNRVGVSELVVFQKLVQVVVLSAPLKLVSELVVFPVDFKSKDFSSSKFVIEFPM